MDRREFLGATTVVLLGSAVRTQGPSPVRRAINNLPAADPLVASYTKAVDKLRKLPTSDPRNWENQATIHNQFCPHTNWWFLPWHRAYLFYFEAICRDVLGDQTFMLPYWDWSANQQIPAPFLDTASPLFDSTRGSTSVNPSSVSANVVSALVGSSALIDIFSGGTTTDTQREPGAQGDLESGPHNSVHATILGNMGTFMSPRDPIFWLHHCNIDRVWASWRKASGHADPTAPLWANHKLAEFYDPVTKKKVSPATSGTSDVNTYRALYDRYHQPPPPAPLAVQLGFSSLLTSGKGLPASIRRAESTTKAAPRVQSAVFRLAVDTNNTLASAVSGASAAMVQLDGRGRGLPRSLSPAPNQLLYLYLDGVTAPDNPSTAFRVFLNCKEPSRATPLTDPTYAGTVSFFAGHDHGEPVSFALNVTATLGRIVNQAIYSAVAPLDVALVPVDNRNPSANVAAGPQVKGVRLVSLESTGLIGRG